MSSLSISFSILSCFKISWKIGCTLSICNDTAPATATQISLLFKQQQPHLFKNILHVKNWQSNKVFNCFILDNYQTDLLENTKAKNRHLYLIKKKIKNNTRDTKESAEARQGEHLWFSINIRATANLYCDIYWLVRRCYSVRTLQYFIWSVSKKVKVSWQLTERHLGTEDVFIFI